MTALLDTLALLMLYRKEPEVLPTLNLAQP